MKDWAYRVVIGGHGALPCRATEESLGRFLGESFDSLDRGLYGLHIERRSRENTETFWVILVAAAWPRRRSFGSLGVFEFQDFRVLSWRRDDGPVCKLYGLVWVKAKLLLAWTRILDSFIFVIFKILMGVGFENYGLGKKKKKIVLLFSEKNNSIWILLRAFLPTKGTIQWSIGKFYIHLPPRF